MTTVAGGAKVVAKMLDEIEIGSPLTGIGIETVTEKETEKGAHEESEMTRKTELEIRKDDVHARLRTSLDRDHDRWFLTRGLARGP